MSILKNLFIERKSVLPRRWSNQELKKFASLFTGDVVNVSAWKDADKEGKHYKDYFSQATDYYITNYKEEARGFQGYDEEIRLDLTDKIDDKLKNHFDVVFNHTTLEHIYNVKEAFHNLCLLSRDIVIVVVPFMQLMHADYGDYWRFTPSAIKKLYEENGFNLLYLSFNNQRHASVYIFAIGSKNPEKWKAVINNKFDITCQKDFGDVYANYIGSRAITNNILFKISLALKKACRRFFK